MVTLDHGGGGRPYLTTQPCVGGAADLAELTWIQRRIPVRVGDSWRIVPDTHPHLIHYRTADGPGRTRLVGPRSRFVDIARDDRLFTVGVRLLPGALPALLGTTAWEIRDRSIAASEAFALTGSDLDDRLQDAPSAERVEEILRGFVASRAHGRRVEWRVRGFVNSLTTAREAQAPRPVKRAAARLGVSERSLREVCRTELGLRPKEAHRILRLHRALALGLAGRTDVDSARLAGYSDQAHLIRESRALLGATPRAFRARGRAVSFKTGHLTDG